MARGPRHGSTGKKAAPESTAQQHLSSRTARRWNAQFAALDSPNSKSRLCVHGHKDPDTHCLNVHSPPPLFGGCRIHRCPRMVSRRRTLSIDQDESFHARSGAVSHLARSVLSSNSDLDPPRQQSRQARQPRAVLGPMAMRYWSQSHVLQEPARSKSEEHLRPKSSRGWLRDEIEQSSRFRFRAETALRAIDTVSQQQGDSVDISLVESATKGTNWEF